MSQITLGILRVGVGVPDVVTKTTIQTTYTTLNQTTVQDITPLIYAAMTKDIVVELDLSVISGIVTLKIETETDEVNPRQALEYEFPADNDSPNDLAILIGWIGKGVDFKVTLTLGTAQVVVIPIAIAEYSF